MKKTWALAVYHTEIREWLEIGKGYTRGDAEMAAAQLKIRFRKTFLVVRPGAYRTIDEALKGVRVGGDHA